MWKEGIIINQEVLFKYQDYVTTKQLICCSEKRKNDNHHDFKNILCLRWLAKGLFSYAAWESTMDTFIK